MKFYQYINNFRCDKLTHVYTISIVIDLLINKAKGIMMIKLFGFGPAFGVICASPFVVKVDAFMRLTDIKFESVSSARNLQKSPKGKLPFITDGDITIADSQFIIAYLQEKYQVDLDSHLSDKEKAIAHLIGKSLDESLYWCLVYSRWIKEDSWLQVKEPFFGSMPFPLKAIVPTIARKGVRAALNKQGFGRHTEEELLSISNESFKSLSVLLGENIYFFGDKPSTFDAIAYAFLCEFITVSLDNNFNELARSYSNLVNYCENITATYYSS